MNLPQLADKAERYARNEIEEYGLPTPLHFDLSLQKGLEIALAVGADKDIVRIGVCLMDLKLGEAFSKKCLGEHVKMSVDATVEFLDSLAIDSELKDRIVNCVEAHHGTVPFRYIEAEVAANADCYRFIHPHGLFHFIGTLAKRGLSANDVVKGAEAKLDEKQVILSLEYCKSDLREHYKAFKSLFAAALQGE